MNSEQEQPPVINQARGHSIWLVPSRSGYDYFQALISDLANRGGTVGFSPHITLLGQLPQPVGLLKTKMQTCFGETDSFKLSFSRIGTFPEYFRSIILHIAPNHDLERLHHLAKRVFEPTSDKNFVPHLSLLYSHLDLASKKELLEKVTIEPPTSVRISEVLLMETKGPLSEWREILRIPLGKK